MHKGCVCEKSHDKESGVQMAGFGQHSDGVSSDAGLVWRQYTFTASDNSRSGRDRDCNVRLYKYSL
jgi:hypothetical protein